jgi:hypothetical protein
LVRLVGSVGDLTLICAGRDSDATCSWVAPKPGICWKVGQELA